MISQNRVSSSLTILNKDQNLPPLLLPNINFNRMLLNNNNNNNNNKTINGDTSSKTNSTININNSTNSSIPPLQIPSFNLLKNSNNHINNLNNNSNLNKNGLDHLASLASLVTKDRNLSSNIDIINTNTTNNNNIHTISNDTNSMVSNIGIASITPPPSSASIENNNKNNNNSVPSSSPSPSTSSISTVSTSPSPSLSGMTENIITTKIKTEKKITKLPKRRKHTNSNNKLRIAGTYRPKNRTNVETNSTTPGNKRQRIGPSCDKCRLKKIKCNANVEILTQDKKIIYLISKNLHYILKLNDILINKNYLINDLNISTDIINDLINNYSKNEFSLIKHIDKIILFKPCTSCAKKKTENSEENDSANQHEDTSNNEYTNSQFHCCKFSKGFTRADINVFSKIALKVVKKPIFEMNCDDYDKLGL